MASIPAVFALETKRIEKKLVAECAKNNLVELFLDEFMTVHLVHFTLAFANGALTS